MSSACRALPALAAATPLLTIAVCYALARANGDLPAWLRVPQISLLGCSGPERTAFSCGFVASALLLVACVALYLGRALPRFEPWLRWEVRAAAVLVLLGACGLALLGAVPLQRDCIACLLGRAALRRESLVHSAGATLFFTCSWLHGLVAVHAYGRSPRNSACAQLGRARALRAACVALPAVGMPVAAFGAAGAPSPAVRLQIGAAHQWLAASCLLALYLSYCVDIVHFESEARLLDVDGAGERLGLGGGEAEAGGGGPPSEYVEWREVEGRTASSPA